MIIHRNRKISAHLILIMGVLALGAAQAQEVLVNSADPASAEQGTVNLDVSIAGEGFDNSAQVFFLVTGTENSGGIIVNSVKVRGPKKIIANIDVATDAVTDDFDVEVQLQSGRKGKGTTLFKVLQQSGNPGSGNQDEDGTAVFSGDVYGSLMGGFVTHTADDYETMNGQLTGGETLTVTGSAGVQLIAEDHGSPVGILPSGVGFLPSGCGMMTACDSVVFNSASPTEWTIRLDHNEEPADRVQFRLSWHNEAGEQHFFRVGWITKLPDAPSGANFGVLVGGSSLADASVEYDADPIRIDGLLLKGNGKKTDQSIYVYYGDGYLATFDIATSVP